MPRKLTSQEAASPTLEHIDYTPLTFWQRTREYISDHWKMLLFLLLAVIGVIIAFNQLNKEPLPDVKVIFISSSYVLPDETKEKLQNLLMVYADDANKDTAQYAKVYPCFYDVKGTATGERAEAAALTEQLLADDTYYIIFADSESFTWLSENGFISKLGQFTTNRPDIEPDALGFLISDSNIFGYVSNGIFAFAGDDYGLSNAFADYRVAFKTGDYDELTGEALTAYRTSSDFYEAVMSTIVTTASVATE